MLLAGCLALVGIGGLARFSSRSVLDDSYIVSRYADNVLATGRLSWNPGAEPTYGLTGPLYLVVVAPLRAVASDSPALALSLSSLLCGVASILLMIQMARKSGGGGALHRRIAVGLVLFSCASSIETFASHLLSGMDTMFAIAYLTAYFLLLLRREARGGAAHDMMAGAWGALAFLARPDLLIFTVSVPLLLWWLNVEAPARSSARRLLAVTLGALALLVAFTTWYFDSALPLPFRAKGLRFYGDFIYERYAGVALAQLRSFGTSYWFLFALAGVNIVLGPRQWWRSTPPLEKGILAGTVAFLAYHATLVLPIMSDSQRFYYPTLPALVYLGNRGLFRLIKGGRGLSSWRWPARAVAACCAAIGLWGLVRACASEWEGLRVLRAQGGFARFSLSETFARGELVKVWPGLDIIAGLPDDLVIATTEVGFPAAMNPGKRIVDLAGLNETGIVLGRFSPAELLRAILPDVIYLPHSDYREMNRAIRAEPDLLSRYQLSSGTAEPPSLDVAILRESPHYASLRAIVAERGSDRGDHLQGRTRAAR